MLRNFRLALAQLNTTVGDIEGNTARIIEYVERAREAGADLVAFPELAITGYPPEDLLFKTSFLQDNVAAMRRVVAARQRYRRGRGLRGSRQYGYGRGHRQRRRHRLRRPTG